jgi:peptidyl-prolyl cis-trans isomerase B (cyclophilin B)
MQAASPLVSLLMSLFSVLLPTKMWFTPSQPIAIRVDSKTPVSLVLTRFDGSPVAAKGSTDAPAGDATVDLRTIYPTLTEPGTFVLFAVPKGKTIADFVGTPVVIEVRSDKTAGGPGGPMVVRVEPLRYEVMTTAAGPITMAFYYDVAPNTVESFLSLSSEGYFDGLTFHRIVPGFVIQGGDPKGDGTGGPGYTVNQEFNDHKHLEGVLSMARTQDPNSAGSQFFVCLDYAQTQHLDNQYTAFGIVTDGMAAVKKIAGTPLASTENGTPSTPQVITKAEVFAVTPGHNPYASLGLGK